MSSWTERMHRRAATFSNVVTSCGHPTYAFPHRLEKVKFGVHLDEVCKNDIPAPLLVLILKLNKEAPFKKDVFRAPGYQGSMKKLSHFLQAGRLVNIDNFSVYTIASVLKKFLRKIPGGIFGRINEQRLFHIITLESMEEQRNEIHRLITSMPVHTQRLLVLLFGTFRVIAANADRAGTGMTSEALGVSVAPSFFQSCVSDGKTAKMEDVLRYKAEVNVATRIMKFLIDNFGVSNLFGRENYEFYARITGRILKVEDDWIFSFRYPPDSFVSPMSHQEESQSTPALIHIPGGLDPSVANSSLGIIPENNLLESYTRLSISLEENGLFKVHERQTERMRTRSEWFLTPTAAAQFECAYGGCIDSDPTLHVLRGANTRSSSSNIGAGLSASAESVQKRPSIRRTNSRSEKTRHLVHRNSSRRNKENGQRGTSDRADRVERASGSGDCTPPSEQINLPSNVTLTYKPRI
ncbi:rho GTPase-activating protein 20 isoform X3 [Frankliniella occidentalis]|uniref:Rho GTPase-activating protein 20 isoform X3 n=1 Tax=Frankliniella occidentalis TaxID=133901 RepID=A0A9C6U0M7_FRAOC|nr:rho GTPase-activating protein 20 isoform X3 [Frankliniella occidentalis]